MQLSGKLFQVTVDRLLVQQSPSTDVPQRPIDFRSGKIQNSVAHSFEPKIDDFGLENPVRLWKNFEDEFSHPLGCCGWIEMDGSIGLHIRNNGTDTSLSVMNVGRPQHRVALFPWPACWAAWSISGASCLSATYFLSRLHFVQFLLHFRWQPLQ